MKNKLNINKTIITVLIMNTFVLLSIAGLFTYNYFIEASRRFYDQYVLYTVGIVAILNTYITIRDNRILTQFELQQSLLKSTLEQLEDLNRILRSQRHDFMNHLQVVYGLIDMEEYGETREYIEKLYQDIQKVNRILKTSLAPVNALLQAKIIYGEKKGIAMTLNVTSKLDAFPIPSWEMCRVLGNIIDNAIYALNNVSGQKSIEIDIYEDIKMFGFRVKDNGPAIPLELKNKIFDAGFTTKDGKGEGMGLSIAMTIIARYGGKISTQNINGSTIFMVYVPKQIKL